MGERSGGTDRDDDVHSIVAKELHRPIQSAEPVRRGLGNENWKVRTGDGEELCVKFGPRASAAKWAATAKAYELANAAGVAAPRLLHVDQPGSGDRIMRVLTWVDGDDAANVLAGGDPGVVATFFTGLGVALRRLHSLPVPAFTSRLDGSAPTFTSWRRYVEHRVPAVVARCSTAAVFDEATLLSITDEVVELAGAVDAVVTPSLCHRDLNLGNVLAARDGSFTGLIDFDAAEAWDPAVDLVKLRWQAFPAYEGSATAFTDGYLSDGEWPPMWEQRLRIVDLLELTNTIANAGLDGDAAYEERAWKRLDQLLGEPGL